MAIYHLRASVISRSQGRSATASAAYRAAERIADARTGLVFDYAARGGVDHAEILAPDHAPDWVHDRSELWNRVEAAETRKNSQVAREVRVALPAELSHDQRVELVRDFARAQFVDRGMVADIALHAPGREGDGRNHHAHILLTTREVDAEGFTAKNRDWNKVEVLEGWREAWARDTNRALERADIAERVDHRTLVAQRDEARELAGAARDRGDEAEELVQTVRAVSLDRPALPQLSPGAWQMKERGIEVGRVGAWHEARARAAEVMTLARDLAGQVREWLEVRLDRVAARFPERDRLAAAGPAYEEGRTLGRTGTERTEGRDGDSDDLATRLHTAWEAWQRGDADRGRDRGAEDEAERRAPEPEARDQDDDMPDLARRLERAVSRMDPAQLGRAAAALRESRAADERAMAREAAEVREAERLREREKERELESERERLKEWSRGLSWDR